MAKPVRYGNQCSMFGGIYLPADPAQDRDWLTSSE